MAPPPATADGDGEEKPAGAPGLGEADAPTGRGRSGDGPFGPTLDGATRWGPRVAERTTGLWAGSKSDGWAGGGLSRAGQKFGWWLARRPEPRWSAAWTGRARFRPHARSGERQRTTPGHPTASRRRSSPTTHRAWGAVGTRAEWCSTARVLSTLVAGYVPLRVWSAPPPSRLALGRLRVESTPVADDTPTSGLPAPPAGWRVCRGLDRGRSWAWSAHGRRALGGLKLSPRSWPTRHRPQLWPAQSAVCRLIARRGPRTGD